MSSAADMAHLREADYYSRLPDGRLLCTLCPRDCKLGEGQAGFCFIRQNIGGRLYQLGYGRSTGFAVDPIEKKPLNHFLPGTDVLSFGTAGCNLGCRFCQNWDISKAQLTQRASARVEPNDVVRLAQKTGSPSIAYTYNDPVIWAEFVIDISKAARQAGIRNVLVTAGYVREQAREDLYRHADATNVDLKAFTEGFYRKYTLSHLEPVKDTLKWLVHKTTVWTEITTLLIPGLNDGDEEIRQLGEWVLHDLTPDVPLHFTAFHPDFKMIDRPRTPPSTLARARRIAREVGLRYVYTGNIHDEEGATTLCPSCGARLISRDWHAITRYRIQDGGCPDCHARIPGVFEPGTRGPTRNRRRLLGLVEGD
jgi:pyruvate formate lyase activating enzyme